VIPCLSIHSRPRPCLCGPALALLPVAARARHDRFSPPAVVCDLPAREGYTARCFFGAHPANFSQLRERELESTQAGTGARISSS